MVQCSNRRAIDALDRSTYLLMRKENGADAFIALLRVYSKWFAMFF